MEIDYYAQSPYTVYDLVNDLDLLIENNPSIDFTKVSINMNQEYTCGRVTLDSWTYKNLARVEIALENK